MLAVTDRPVVLRLHYLLLEHVATELLLAVDVLLEVKIVLVVRAVPTLCNLRLLCLTNLLLLLSYRPNVLTLSLIHI